jgi:uncharacterized membrane protein YeaQ/YmgE (transglycosylase-associated protein family)
VRALAVVGRPQALGRDGQAQPLLYLNGITTLHQENIMGVIAWIVFGLIVGVVAKFLMPGRDPGGFFVTILLGIVGAVVGGFLGRAVGWYGQDDPVGFVMAVLGAIALLIAYRLIARRPRQA